MRPSLTPELLETDLTRSAPVLIKRRAVDSDFVDGLPRSVESYDAAEHTVEQWISIGEAEDLDLLYPQQAAEMRAQMSAVREMKGAA